MKCNGSPLGDPFSVRPLAGSSPVRRFCDPALGQKDNKHPDMQNDVVAHFNDGEEMVGLSNAFLPNRSFFSTLPIDAESNNVRVLGNRDVVSSIRPRAE